MWNQFPNHRLCLDFLATAFGPHPRSIDLLRHWSDLRCWIEISGVVDDARVESLELQRAKMTRQLIGEVLRASAHAKAPTASDELLRPLNGLARASRPQLQLVEGSVVRTGGFDAFLAEVATDTLALLSTDGQIDRVRWCSMPWCNRVFLDRSATGQRRWCSKRCRDQRSAALYRGRASQR